MPLLEPNPQALRPGTKRSPAPDRVPELTKGTPRRLREELSELLGAEKVLSDLSDLVRYASDASPYRFVPQVVVVAEDIDDISAVLSYAHGKGREVVFRAAGTSLNGQAQGEDILVDVRRHWAGVEVLDGGARARIRPGTTVVRANAALAPHGRVLGPDPASAIACTLGGVVANNASGMTAGTTRNSYRTLASLTFVLPSGTVVDTADPAADEELARAEPRLCAELLALKAEIEADAELTARIRAKYAIKNTNGYRLDAFLDGATPVRILRGLMVGSEGTFGFIAETVFDTLPLDREVSTALLFFPSLPAAAAAVPLFNEAGALAVELMDGNTLRASVSVAGVPADWAELPKETAALLVEFRAPDAAAREAYERAADAVLAGLALVAPVPSVENAFTRDPKRISGYWKARKAFVSAVGGSRPSGTTLITEDFAVPPDRLAEACAELLDLQSRHGFDAAVAGHAAHGNLHFLLAFDAGDPADVERYAAFMDEFCKLTVERFDGSLKAEHATGRNIAPFLELEWGTKATELMWRVKETIDPDGVLAPRIVLDRDPQAHLRGLKTIPTVERIVDPCIECGFCEPTCPSQDLTTTPRQRIALRREMMRQPDGSPVEARLLEAYGYDAVDTCAGDSTCKLACPVGIDTGALMKEFRHERHSPREERIAALAARNFRAVEASARLAVAAADRIGDRVLERVTGLARKAVRPDLVPEWLPEIPGAAARRLPRTHRPAAAAVYFPACVNRIFGGPDGHRGPSLPEAVVAVSARAGKPVWIPDDVAGTCCATIWHSKGYERGNEVMANRIVEAAWGWTAGGKLPLVVDASSCTLGIAQEVVPYLTADNRELHAELTVLDSLVWAADELLPRLDVRRRVTSAVVHPTCSMRHLGDEEQLTRLAGACAEEVVVPADAGCCAFAGDRGMLHPELTASATAREAAEVTARSFDAHLSANRMCEIGMDRATGRTYQSVLLALERATRP
ncbi:putative D-lactate dehydrogenase [Streptomyces venezuelae]|uniref:FAD-binding and (Fe-S)-binding domain-containing protein n=1 Tax=Streptomyces gardneri TaxID=66892 RepID=UPI0006BCBF25|nr:FAD-binding and (Fe-S)-binding domain-containing protein [Streptomyces gardneri]ALO06796.1 putative D-lactate dehydrogenase [Streptomyces venezuelae]QPK44186.1 FAD-binding oxidoreductase [Streptomyces gardneri]WRK35467.1 FAD-binding and (Fe-S)-binding domain-containing protein [Streptomyces venezuelae]CUM42909.1 Predicted D-lactate dehydrogenase, Fe-S protein, FAD/FMN-containing [Streptomyces venezuelae]